ncbi:MAG: hypothetical protein II259_04335 [Selenomonadaceae bacterium]|nr:hypothetical protein [Selenomonadaceae bacterium]
MSSKLLKPDVKSTRNATEMLIPNMDGITVGEMDRLKLNTGWLNNILGEHLLLVQRLRWLLLAEFCLGLSKGITLSVGVTIIMRFLVYWVQDNVRLLSEFAAAGLRYLHQVGY